MAGQIRSIWTNDAAIARLKELLTAKETHSTIARTLNAEFGTSLTRNAIIGKAHRLGLDNGRGKSTSIRLGGKPSTQHNKPFFVFKKRAADDTLPQPYVPPAVAENPSDHHCDIFALTNETCRWPLGKWNVPVRMFCGSPTADLELDRPYCPVHMRRAAQRYAGQR